jgi:hypothetical protein
MTNWNGVAVALALAFVNPTTSHAAPEPITGRWAANDEACALFGGSPLVVSDYAVRWANDACRVGRMSKTGDTVHIQALCWGEGGERSIPVALRAHAGRLAVSWDRSRRGDLKRCP